MDAATESSPLLTNNNNNDASKVQPRKLLSRAPVLAEIVGARHLPISDMDTYCVIQYGSKSIHRTQPFSPKVSRATQFSRALRLNLLFGRANAAQLLERSLQNPIWTILEDSLFALDVSRKDLDNHKALVISVFARRRQKKLQDRVPRKYRQNDITLVGKIRIPSPTILKCCTQERLEMQLMDDLGNGITSFQNEQSMVALRFRVASDADLAFCRDWNRAPRVNPPKLWKDADILHDSDKPHGILVTELPENLIQGSNLASAMAGSLDSTLSTLSSPGNIRVKPYPDPDPDRPSVSQYMTPSYLKTQTVLPSKSWVQAGSSGSSIGRLFLEVLSAHNLPNVDLGGKVGNQTDAFCAIIYGDSMVQTDVIDDELNPHWPNWTQRAFLFHMQHPSQVLYLGVFGFKRNPLHHKPIGRVEINLTNLQRDTLYNLEYNLCGASHAAERRSQGKIRIRVRVEVDDERKALLAALRPQPAIYINVTKKKSMVIARYTSCGEYDNEEKFSLQVLQGYIDEIVEGYLKRILYSIEDGGRSLIFWRNQVYWGKFGLPLYSFMLFVMGMLVVEYPQIFPSFFCFAIALFSLVQMQHRLKMPSPWRRCFSFGHYLRILIIGKSTPKYKLVEANEGFNAMQAKDEAHTKRIERDRVFSEKRESVIKEVEELEGQVNVEDKSKVVPLELMVVLGKVQAIVGGKWNHYHTSVSKWNTSLTERAHNPGFCRLLRLLDAIVTWEESDLTFFITATCLVASMTFLFVPWAFLLRIIGRLLVVLVLGPQNKVLDLLWYQNQENDEEKIRKDFEKRFFEARSKQEEAGKLKAFRHVLFGKYSTLVPPILWTPHQDFPLPTSTAQTGLSKNPGPKSCKKIPVIIGQQLHGKMIPRPEQAWRRNEAESRTYKQEIESKLLRAEAAEGPVESVAADAKEGGSRENSMILDEGFEVTEMFDKEAVFVRDMMKQPREESLHELGIEVLGSEDEEALRFIPAWRSVHNFSEAHSDCDSEDSSNSSIMDRKDWGALHTSSKSSTSAIQYRDMDRDRQDSTGESLTELGVEVADEFDEEAQFVQQSWRGCAMENIPKADMENGTHDSSGACVADLPRKGSSGMIKNKSKPQRRELWTDDIKTHLEDVTKGKVAKSTAHDEWDIHGDEESPGCNVERKPTVRDASADLGFEIIEP